MTQFSAGEREQLANAAEVEIETRRASGGSNRRTIIWIVVDGERVYIRSVRGAAGAWYGAVTRDKEAQLHAGSSTWAVRATPVTDAAEVERVSRAIDQKYRERWPGPTAAMLRPDVLGTTLRIEPA
jgi:hypothetical protein